MKKNLLIISSIICAFLFSTNVFAQEHLLLTEATVTPTPGEFIEITNISDTSVDLTNYYLTDDEDYALYPGTFGTGPAPNIGSSDFIAQFPAASVIAPFQTIVIAFDGAGFITEYGFAANFEIKGTDTLTTDMIPSNVGTSAGLTNSGENACLFYWDGLSDLVMDVDMVNIGTPSSANDIGNKTGVEVDGPDADTLKTMYLADGWTMPQQLSDPGSGFSTKRVKSEDTYEVFTGGNGITGHDETTENILATWDTMYTAPDPGILVIPIAVAIDDGDGDFVPDLLGLTVAVKGVVFSPNYQSTNNSFYIDDGTAGTDIFMFGPPAFSWAMGDELLIIGEVAQFRGMTEIIPADSSGWVLVSSGNPTPEPIVISLGQYKADPETYEGSLIGFTSLTLVGGTWPTSGSANLDFSDGVDTVTFRIDSDTDIPGQPEPTWPQDIIGIGSQFTFSVPPNDGYQIFPRAYATDFLPPGTIPVELTSFAASVSGNSVTLNWSTATELNNSGFDVLRSTEESVWEKIGFVAGFGTTTEIHSYSFVDENLASGSYAYRLKQVDYDGTFELSDVVNVEVINPDKYSLSQNYPNPFNPSTTIKFTLAESGNVTLKIYNTLGEEVALLVNQVMESGNHEVNFNAFNLGSGIYFYRIEAGDFSQVKKMTLLK